MSKKAKAPRKADKSNVRGNMPKPKRTKLRGKPSGQNWISAAPKLDTNTVEATRMPIFLCTKCGRSKSCEYEVSCTGDIKRNVEKSPECCGKPMIETVE